MPAASNIGTQGIDKPMMPHDCPASVRWRPAAAIAKLMAANAKQVTSAQRTHRSLAIMPTHPATNAISNKITNRDLAFGVDRCARRPRCPQTTSAGSWAKKLAIAATATQSPTSVIPPVTNAVTIGISKITYAPCSLGCSFAAGVSSNTGFSSEANQSGADCRQGVLLNGESDSFEFLGPRKENIVLLVNVQM